MKLKCQPGAPTIAAKILRATPLCQWDPGAAEPHCSMTLKKLALEYMQEYIQYVSWSLRTTNDRLGA